MTGKRIVTLAELKARALDQSGKGLECPKCGCHHFETVLTRQDVGRVRRKRQCRNCGHTITTLERPAGT